MDAKALAVVRAVNVRPARTEAQMKRLHDAWRDPDVQLADTVTRFELSNAEVEALRRLLGPKPRPMAISAWAKASQTAKRKRQAGRR